MSLTKLSERFGEIYDEMKRNGCKTLIITDDNGDLQLAQSNVTDRFKTREAFVSYMSDGHDAAAYGYLNWSVLSLGVMYQHNDVYSVTIARSPRRF